MKSILRKLFRPILGFFEGGDEPYRYDPRHRKILLVVGLLFLVLTVISGYFGSTVDGFGFLIPCGVFFLVGTVCLVVGFLGSGQAVAKIWGSR